MPSPTMKVKTPGKKRAVSTRWLALCLALCASVTGYIWWWDGQLRREYEARLRLTRMGASVELAPKGSAWLHRMLGEKYLQNAVTVRFVGDRLQDDDLTVFADLPNIEEISLVRATKITDAGLSHLSGLQQLQRLNLVDSPIEGRGFLALKNLPRLSELHLGPTTNDRTLAGIAELPAIERLYFASSEITGSGLMQLLQLPRLRHVQLLNTGKISEEHVAQLRLQLQEMNAERRRRGDVDTGEVVVVFNKSQ